jgi:prepilin-type N-terminal cleavage/methylation domain-containing protein
MKFKTKTNTAPPHAAKLRHAAFTLVEILVAIALMAAVVPVTVEGLKIASLAGEVSQRKAMAVRIAERVLNETIVAGQWNGVQSGSEQAGPIPFRWKISNAPWTSLSSAVSVNTSSGLNQAYVNQNNLHQLTVEVTFTAQDKTCAVQLSTVADVSRQVTVPAPPQMTSLP